jgi:magnesium-transporting ATPase (P-type)
MKFLDQFRNFLVIVLLGAAMLAGVVGDLKDALVIAMIVVLLNATFGFFQEHRAEAGLAALTGESHAVAKGPEAVPEKSALAERRSMAFRNTVVSRGRIEAVVTATGMQTEMGRIAGLLEEAAESATPLQVQLDRLGKRLAAMASVAIFELYWLRCARST